MADYSSHPRYVSIAPMLDWTDRHERYLLRLISKHVWLYSEMVTTGALIYGNAQGHLLFDPAEQPVALQLGGSDPEALVTTAKMAEDQGYAEVNLNCGCPSERVQNGTFGVVLMQNPDLVARCVEAMRKEVNIPVTVKCRLGVDDLDKYSDFKNFISTVRDAGCEHFIVHARKARLKLSPKDNREVPKIKYGFVYEIKREFPDLHISINGDVKSIDKVEEHLKYVDGVMLGRLAYNNPWSLATVDQRFYGSTDPIPDRLEVLEKFYPYVEKELANGTKLPHITRHLMGLFPKIPGARFYRRHLAEESRREGAGIDVIQEALKFLEL